LQVFDGTVFWVYSQYMSIMANLRYQIDMSDLPNHSDLNISQTSDPPIYGYIVKLCCGMGYVVCI